MSDKKREALDRLKRWLQRSEAAPWPILVAHPLKELYRSIAEDRPAAAAIFLREAAEGMARTIWCVAARDVLELSYGGFDGLSDDEREACRAVLKDLLRGRFTFGSALHRLWNWNWKGSGLVDVLAGTLDRERLPLLAKLGMLRAQGPLWKLAAWRNSFAHGFVGSEDRLRDVYDPAKEPLSDLLAAFEELDDWLAEAQAMLSSRHRWPAPADLSGTPPGGMLQGAPRPLAFRGESAWLWLLDIARPDSLDLRDPIGGRALRFRTEGLLDPEWLELVVAAVGPVGPLDLAAGAAKEEREALESRRRRRQGSFSIKPLREKLEGLLVNDRVWVRGRAGSGKSFFLLDVHEKIEKGKLPAHLDPSLHWIPLLVRGIPGSPRTSFDLARDIENALDAARHPGLRLGPVDRRIASLSEKVKDEGPKGAKEWWENLRQANPNLGFLVLVDGLEDFEGEAPLAALPAEVEGCRAVLASRPEDELPQGVRKDLAGFATLDLDAFYTGPEGRDLLLHYLRERHGELPLHRPLELSKIERRDPGLAGILGELPAKPTLANAIVERAERRFLWVFHYARGLEQSFLRPERPGEWPAPDTFYHAYLAWLEERSGRNPRYCATLRAVMLTYAELIAPVDDRTLIALLHEGPAGNDTAEEDFAHDFVLPILRDLDDFILREHTGRDHQDPDLRRAWRIVAFDCEEGRTGAARVSTLAHPTFREFLRDGADLPEGWLEARLEVRRRLVRRCLARARRRPGRRPGLPIRLCPLPPARLGAARAALPAGPGYRRTDEEAPRPALPVERRSGRIPVARRAIHRALGRCARDPRGGPARLPRSRSRRRPGPGPAGGHAQP